MDFGLGLNSLRKREEEDLGWFVLLEVRELLKKEKKGYRRVEGEVLNQMD